MRVSHLFEGFQGPRFVPLLIIGAVNLGLVIVLFLVVGRRVCWARSALDDCPRCPIRWIRLAAPLQAHDGTPASRLPARARRWRTSFAMLNWFAPALVALRGVSAIDAMKLSFVSCLRNWLPFLLYGLVDRRRRYPVVTIAVVVVALPVGGRGDHERQHRAVPAAAFTRHRSC